MTEIDLEDDDCLEVDAAPRFIYGERVLARCTVRNDGTVGGQDIGAVLVSRGALGYVTGIHPFLQQFYIYAVDFVDSGRRVGMRAKELCTLDHLPDEVIARLTASTIAELGLTPTAAGPKGAP